MPRRASPAVTALGVGAVLSAIGLGIDWLGRPDLALPGRVLAARLFLLLAAATAIGGALRAARDRRRAAQLALAASASIVAAFAVTVRQIGLANISATALILVAAALAAFVTARRTLGAAAEPA